MNATEQLTVPQIIAKQIGGRAFYMMGTMSKIGDGNTLIFNLRGSPKHISKIRVTLDPSDTYTLEFWRGAIGKHPAKLETSISGVYAEGLNQAIEHHTMLALSL